jgi:hypothetical protein
MRGAIQLPQYVFMASSLVKHRDNFTFTVTSIYSVLKERLDLHGLILTKSYTDIYNKIQKKK